MAAPATDLLPFFGQGELLPYGGQRKEQRIRERVHSRAAWWPFPVLLPWPEDGLS